ncbi:hypothetical protein GGI24_005422, partial [Coemansia furcata]
MSYRVNVFYVAKTENNEGLFLNALDDREDDETTTVKNVMNDYLITVKDYDDMGVESELRNKMARIIGRADIMLDDLEIDYYGLDHGR